MPPAALLQPRRLIHLFLPSHFPCLLITAQHTLLKNAAHCLLLQVFSLKAAAVCSVLLFLASLIDPLFLIIHVLLGCIQLHLPGLPLLQLRRLELAVVDARLRQARNIQA